MDNPLWGCLPPYNRYNMYQVPLTFMVNNDITLTTHDNNEIHISASINDLRKRKFTMHVVVNTREGDKRQGFVDVVLKVTGKIIYRTEQEIWDARGKVFYHKNAWVDTPVTMNISEIFVTHKVEVHGYDTWVLLFYDNLKDHMNDQVRNIFGDAKVLLY